MNREEAILNAAEIANILEKRGLNGAANSLMESLKVLCTPRNPWVKTSDRLPDAEQIARNDKIFLLCKQHDGTYEAYTHWADGLASHPEKFEFDYWMPVPPLPEPFARGHENGGNREDAAE